MISYIVGVRSSRVPVGRDAIAGLVVVTHVDSLEVVPLLRRHVSLTSILHHRVRVTIFRVCSYDWLPLSAIASADVDFGNLIGSGSFGDVFKAKCKDTGKLLRSELNFKFYVQVSSLPLKSSLMKTGTRRAKLLRSNWRMRWTYYNSWSIPTLYGKVRVGQHQLYSVLIRSYLGHEFIPPNVEWDPLPRDSAVHHRLLQHRCSMGRLLVIDYFEFLH